MKTRAMRLAPNRDNVEDDSLIKESDSIRNIYNNTFEKQESIIIPNVEIAYKNKTITLEEYAYEILNE